MTFLQGLLANFLAKMFDKVWSAISKEINKRLAEKIQHDKVDTQLDAVSNAKAELRVARKKQKQLDLQDLVDPKVDKEVKQSEERLIDASRHLLRDFWY